MNSNSDPVKEQRRAKYGLLLQTAQLRHALSLVDQSRPQADVLTDTRKNLADLINVQEDLYRADQLLAEQTKEAREAGLTQKATFGGGTAAPTVEQLRRAGSRTKDLRGTKLALGRATTGLTATVTVKMPQVPTAYYPLLDPATQPLLECAIENHDDRIRRLRVVSFIEGYTAQAVSTLEIPGGEKPAVCQSPIFFPEPVRRIREVTRASLNVLAEDLENKQVEVHMTLPIWLLARNSAPLPCSRPEKPGELPPFAEFLGVFVTPHDESVMQFLWQVAEYVSTKKLEGYAGQPSCQAQAIYQALAEKSRITYVDSVLDFTPEGRLATQRVRLPRESLRQRQANCLDGALLFASLLEAIGIHTALVILPGHALVGWQTDPNCQNGWQYLDTTKVGRMGFARAVELGNLMAEIYAKRQENAGKEPGDGQEGGGGMLYFLRLELQDLRDRGIMPMV